MYNLLYETPTCQMVDLILPRQSENLCGEKILIYTFDN